MMMATVITVIAITGYEGEGEMVIENERGELRNHRQQRERERERSGMAFLLNHDWKERNESEIGENRVNHKYLITGCP